MESLSHQPYADTSSNTLTQTGFKPHSLKTHSLTISYLKREITCLEKQLKRIRMQNKPMYTSTISTYDDMINARKAKLHTIMSRVY